MRNNIFKDFHWEKHGDYWLMIDKKKTPVAALIEFDGHTVKKETLDDEHRVTRSVRCIGD